VRTYAFKAWFGDWEAARGLAQLKNMRPTDLSGIPLLGENKADFASAFLGFGSVVNKMDGRSVTFPNNTAGKIHRHKGFDYRLVAGAFDELFARSIPMLSELEEVRPGHKDHSSNIQAYHHYVSKFEQGRKLSYVRFTIQQLKQGRAKQERNEVHSAMVSARSLYEENEQGAVLDSSAWGQIASRVITESASRTAPLDRKLATWIAAGNSKLLSSFLSAGTGEPLAEAVHMFIRRQNT